VRNALESFAFLKEAAILYRRVIAKIPPLAFLGLIWAAAFIMPGLGMPYLGAAAVVLWLSAAFLAPGKMYGRRLMKAAFLCAVTWSIFLALLHLIGSAALEPIPRLWAFMALGLHLMLAKSPLDLALPLGRLLAPVIGRVRAQKVALALALTARLIPRLLEAAFSIQRSLSLRCPKLSRAKRIALWGKAIMRDSFARSEEMARALVKRWPWPGSGV
jgi:energy-coupling factor transporter transmembrane protein EcfT